MSLCLHNYQVCEDLCTANKNTFFIWKKKKISQKIWTKKTKESGTLKNVKNAPTSGNFHRKNNPEEMNRLSDFWFIFVNTTKDLRNFLFTLDKGFPTVNRNTPLKAIDSPQSLISQASNSVAKRRQKEMHSRCPIGYS